MTRYLRMPLIWGLARGSASRSGLLESRDLAPRSFRLRILLSARCTGRRNDFHRAAFGRANPDLGIDAGGRADDALRLGELVAQRLALILANRRRVRAAPRRTSRARMFRALRHG